MTYQEKVVVSAYTGFLMCDFGDMHRYIEEKMGRPVWTHEMRSSNTEFLEELRRRALPDFLAICNDQSAPNVECDRLRDLVRKLANVAETTLIDAGFYWKEHPEFMDLAFKESFVSEAHALIREARREAVSKQGREDRGKTHTEGGAE